MASSHVRQTELVCFSSVTFNFNKAKLLSLKENKTKQLSFKEEEWKVLCACSSKRLL
jgi:hypothetical protein